MMRHDLMLLLLGGVLGAGSALAQVPDPTRPAAATVAPDVTGAVAAPVESGVQTVIVRPDGKSAAVINGQYVEVGDKLGDKRVLKISESEVVLKGGSGSEVVVIKMTPAIEKTMARKAKAITSRAKETTGTTGK